MKLVKFEFLKVITSKLFIITFVLFALCNFIFLSYDNYAESKSNIPYKAYSLLESNLKNKTHEEKGKFIDEIYERVYGINLIYNIQNNLKSENSGMREYGEYLREENKDLYNKYYEEARNNPTFKYTGDSSIELSFLESVKNEYDKVDNYDSAIDDILVDAKGLQGISIFKESSDDISIKNIERTTNAYESMKGTKVDFEMDKGMEKFTSVTITDFFVLILIFIIATILITEEKEKNLFTIIKSTKNGGMMTILSKITSLFLLVSVISILFYGMNFLYYFFTIGYGNMATTIQSMEMFILSTLKINIGCYLLLFFISKILILFFISCIMFYFTVKFDNSSESIIGIVIILLIDFLFFKGIDLSSNINLLKSFNLISLIDVNNAYSIYDNLQLGSILFEKTFILLILQGIFVVIFLILTIIKYLRSMSITTKDSIILSKLQNIKIFKNIKLSNIFTFETYKLLFTNKVLIIIILFALFLGFNYKNQNFRLSFNESFYKNYMDVLRGDLTLEKETMILNTKNEYIEAEEQLSKIKELMDSGELSIIEGNYAMMSYEDILATREMFMRIEDKYKYIKEHSNAKFVYDTGYNKLFRIDNKMNENDIYLLVVTIISLLGLFTMEYKTGFIHILNATKKGRKITARNKVIATIFIGTIIYAISVIPEIMFTLKTYGLDNLSSSITSLSYFESLPAFITILEYLIIFYIARYVSYIMIILLIEYIALKLKNYVFAFITASSVLLIPFLLNILKFTKTLPFPLINLSWIIGEFQRIIFIPIIVIASIFLYNSILKRLE